MGGNSIIVCLGGCQGIDPLEGTASLYRLREYISDQQVARELTRWRVLQAASSVTVVGYPQGVARELTRWRVVQGRRRRQMDAQPRVARELTRWRVLQGAFKMHPAKLLYRVARELTRWVLQEEDAKRIKEIKESCQGIDPLEGTARS